MLLKNTNLFFKISVSLFLSISCIYLSGTHTHLNFFLLIVLLTLFFKRKIKKYLKGTLIADLLLSILFLSFSWKDYASLNDFRERAFHLSPLYPSIAIFILIVYYSVLREEEFKINDFLNNQTYFPFISLLLGFSSGISTKINPSIGILSSLHLFFLLCFFAFNFFLLLRYAKNDFVLKFLPTSFFIFIVLICKSKFAIFTTISLLFLYGLKIVEIEKRLNNKLIFLSLNLSKIINIFLAFSILLINIFSFNSEIFGFSPKYLDKIVGYRLSINSSAFQACKQINIPKIKPQILPNREYKIMNNLRTNIQDRLFVEERFRYLSKIFNKNKVDSLIGTYPHNSLVYYQMMHGVFWNITLLILIGIILCLFIIQNKLISFASFILFSGLLFFESIPYVNSIILIINSYFLILFSKNILK